MLLADSPSLPAATPLLVARGFPGGEFSEIEKAAPLGAASFYCLCLIVKFVKLFDRQHIRCVRFSDTRFLIIRENGILQGQESRFMRFYGV